MKISGIYKITNILTGDFYIGSSKDIKIRWSAHKSPSSWARFPNSKLYKDMAQYGLNNFTFEVIEETDNFKEREQYWIDQLQPIYNTIRAFRSVIGEELSGLTSKEYYRALHKINRDIDLARMEKYNIAHREEINAYYNRLCFYEGKTLTLNALKIKLSKLGFSHPVQEAKKYLIKDN